MMGTAFLGAPDIDDRRRATDHGWEDDHRQQTTAPIPGDGDEALDLMVPVVRGPSSVVAPEHDFDDYLDAYDRAHAGDDYEALRRVHQQRRAALADVAANDLLSRYMLETNRQRLLTAEEEIALAQDIESARAAKEQWVAADEPAERERLNQLIERGHAARTLLIRSNTRLVISVARRYVNQGLDLLDLIQEGNIGLMTAVEKYDHRYGARFSTYATWWIRQSITRALTTQGRMIRIPAHQTGHVRRLYRAMRDIEQTDGRHAAVEELAARVELPPSEVQWLLQMTRPLLALEQPAGDDEDAELAEFIEDSNAAAPHEAAAESMLREGLGELLNELSPREATVIRMRFGLQGHQPHTLKELSELFKLSRERVRQVEKQALSKLRRNRRLTEVVGMT